jgi:hypothetical protein
MKVLQFSPTPLQALLNPLSGQEMLLMAESQGPSVRADTPSLRDRIGNSVYDLASNLGLGSTANRMRNEGTAVMDFIPGVGEVLGVNDAMNDFNAGNYGMAAAGLGLTAAGAVPGVGDAVANAGRKGIKAYHGSPHDFDRFSMDKIGTGEGAQAYGHGLYFADNEGVAKAYREQLSAGAGAGGRGRVRTFSTPAGEVPAAEKPLADIAWTMQQHGLDPNTPDGAAWLADEIAARSMGGADIAADDVLRYYSGGPISDGWMDGRMYEVSINANPDDFLDWDAPLSAQPAAIRALASSAPLDGATGPTKAKLRAFQGGTENPAMGIQATGQDLHRALSAYGENGPAATSTLQAAGIPGIRYLDQLSRTNLDTNEIRGSLSVWENALRKSPDDPYAMEQVKNLRDQLEIAERGGSRNYVVFDENLVEIVKKYGLAGAVAAGLISQEMAAQMQAQGEL